MALLPEIPDILTAEQVYRGWGTDDDAEKDGQRVSVSELDGSAPELDIEGVATRIAALRRP